MGLSQIYLTTIDRQVPSLSVLMVILLVFGLEERFWWLLLALVPCLMALFLLYNPSIYLPMTDYRKKDMFFKDVVMSIIMVVVFIAVFLDSTIDKTHQLILTGIAIFLMCVVSTMICLSSTSKNLPMNLLAIMVLVCFYILFFVWVSINQKPLRKVLYMAVPFLFSFFVVYYMFTTTRSLYKGKQMRSSPQSIFAFGPFDLHPLPPIEKSMFSAKKYNSRPIAY